jgi:hypothetical protein
MKRFEVGSQPPKGYNAWHEWAEIQHKGGLRQTICNVCGKWEFPQENCETGQNFSENMTWLSDKLVELLGEPFEETTQKIPTPEPTTLKPYHNPIEHMTLIVKPIIGE